MRQEGRIDRDVAIIDSSLAGMYERWPGLLAECWPEPGCGECPEWQECAVFYKATMSHWLWYLEGIARRN